jgi:DNA polymerase-1
MTNITIPRGFDELLFVDFEFSQPAGCVPRVVCASAQEIVSGRGFRVMLDGSVPSTPPWRTDKRCLYIGYSLAAEMSCHLSLGWEMPSYLLDLYFEFRYLTNDFVPAFHRGLVHACLYHNIKLSTDRLTEKQEMRQLAIDWFKRERHDYERKEIQDYCREDVDDTIKLYEAMSPKIDFGRAIAFRGHYAKDVAKIERVGIPIDVKSRTIIVERRDEFQNRLIDTQRERYPVFLGKKFNFALFEKYLADLNILWPRTKSGRLETKDRTFDNLTKAHPLLRDLYDLRTAISQVRNATDVPRTRNGRPIYFMPVGPDNINRSAIMPFGTLSGRNAPSTTAFAFNLATCLRTLIDPRWMPGYERDGYALAYLDYGQQEFAIQAQRSGDENMIAAYKSGDPYTYYPQQAGYTAEQALAQRDQFKRTTLGLGYGMGVSTLCYYVGVDYGPSPRDTDADSVRRLDVQHRRCEAGNLLQFLYAGRRSYDVACSHP